MNIQSFFNTLFDKNEYTCFAKHAKGTKVFAVDEYESTRTWARYFTINPLDGTADHNPTLEYHDAAKPRRADANVTKYRNFLIELDNMPVEDQLRWVEQSGVPVTTAVYSGGKSIHFIVSLEDPCYTSEEYTHVVKRLYAALNSITPGAVDTACKNPSRLSRFPEATRESNGKCQRLIYVGSRVKKERLLTWIEEKIGPELVVDTVEVSDRQHSYPGNSGFLSGDTLNFLMFGAPPGHWNHSLFRAACELTRQGDPLSTIIARLECVTGHLDQKDMATIQSAYNRALSDIKKERGL